MTTEKDDEMLAHLTPAERAALEEDIGDENVSQHDVDQMRKAERLAEIDGETQVRDVDMTVGNEGNEGKAPQPQVEDEPVELAPKIEGPLRAQPAADLSEQIKAIDDAEIELGRKFDEGEITTSEYRDGMKQLGTNRESLNWQTRKAELANEMTETMQKQAWDNAVTDFMTGVGSHLTKSEALLHGFDNAVRRITSDPANHRLSDRAQLEKAYNLFWEESRAAGLNFENAVKKAPRQATPQQQQPQRTRDDSGKFVPTLAKVPAADSEDIDGGKYAALDRLMETDYEAYERQLSKMPPAELDAYMAAR